MNKILFLIAFLFVLIACRQGPEDPVISFRSRTARLTGTWQLMSNDLTIKNYKITDSVKIGFEMKEAFDGSIKTNHYTLFDTLPKRDTNTYLLKKIKKDTILNYNYTRTIKFDDKGYYTLKIKETNLLKQDSVVDFTETKLWYWQSGKKSKDEIMLDKVYQIIKLSNKEMQLSIDLKSNLKYKKTEINNVEQGFYTFKKIAD